MEKGVLVQHSANLSRRDLLWNAAVGAAALMIPGGLRAWGTKDPNLERLTSWVGTLRSEGLARADVPLGRAAIRVGELAVGIPYQPYTLEEYLRQGGSPLQEPLTISLSSFDCVTLVETCLAVARLARDTGSPSWSGLGKEIERMRYRGGKRRGYSSRLHYFSEWVTDGEKRGLLKNVGAELGGGEDTRQLDFMSEHRDRYPALAREDVFRDIRETERRISEVPRRVVPLKCIPAVAQRIETGDVLAFATNLTGLDVTHTAFAYRDKSGTLRVLHAPLSGGVVEVTHTTLPEYVAAIKRSTGILVARPQ
jgi:hypothetical protein